MRLISEGNFIELGVQLESGQVAVEAKAPDCDTVHIRLHQGGDHLGVFDFSPADAKLLARSIYAEIRRANEERWRQAQLEHEAHRARIKAKAEREARLKAKANRAA